jgi:hypothetical protein
MHIEIQRNRARQSVRESEHGMAVARGEGDKEKQAEYYLESTFHAGKVAALERLMDELDDVGDPRGERKRCKSVIQVE